MTGSETSRSAKLPALSDMVFMLWAALFLGALGGVTQSGVVSLVSAAVLAGIFGAYDRILARNTGMKRGLFAGVILGAFVGTMGLLLGGEISDVRSGAILGALLGISLGGIIGIVSRAEFEEGERLFSRLFLFVGSIFLGAFLGGGVGMAAGVFIGLVNQLPAGALLAVGGGVVVGSYLGTSLHDRRAVVAGGVIGGVVTAVSLFIGGVFAGLVMGAIAGCLTPMLFVALIGAVGGLTARGPKAMVVEALEAPSEILEQGAVPFLLPAVIAGAVVGTSGSGPAGLVVMTAVLSLLGLLFGAFGDMNGRSGQQVTFRSVVEMAMMGVDEWPIRRVVTQVMVGWRPALLGGLIGVIIGLLGSGLGYGLVAAAAELLRSA